MATRRQRSRRSLVRLNRGYLFLLRYHLKFIMASNLSFNLFLLLLKAIGDTGNLLFTFLPAARSKVSS